MNVLLIQPPIRDFYRTKFREYPLGLLYIAGSLKQHRFSVDLLDTRLGNTAKKIDIPGELNYLKKYYSKENNLFLNFKHFGMSYEQIGDYAQEKKPDFICISSLFTPYVQEVYNTAKIIKTKLPNVPIITGGHHPSIVSDSLGENKYFDVSVKGEGEEILPSILSNISKNNIPDKSNMVEDIEALPFPARELVDSHDYSFEKRPYTMLLTSRGCPFCCSFCSIHSVTGSRHRTRSIESVLFEIEECIQKYSIEVFDFQDDNLLFDQQFSKKELRPAGVDH